MSAIESSPRPSCGRVPRPSGAQLSSQRASRCFSLTVVSSCRASCVTYENEKTNRRSTCCGKRKAKVSQPESGRPRVPARSASQ